MNNKTTLNLVEIRPSPHIKGPRSVENIMRRVMYMCIILAICFVLQYGMSALLSIIFVTGGSLLTEYYLFKTKTQSSGLHDYSAAITGLLLALTLPPGFPLWMGFVAGAVAIALGKGLFGGLGYNVFNPALIGRAFAQAAFPTAISTYTPSMLPNRFLEIIPSTLTLPMMAPPSLKTWLEAQQQTLTNLGNGLDAITSATPLVLWKFDFIATPYFDLFTGLYTHAMIGVSPLLVILCGLYLASQRCLNWKIPVSIILSAACLAWALHSYDPSRFATPCFTVLSGGLILGAVFMATDMASSPTTPLGMWLYGILIGFLTVMIRNFSGLPEGVMYAILFANAATPLIEKISQRRVFGTGGSDKHMRKGATYPLHPGYISREEHSAVTPEKVIMKHKPKPEDRRKPQREEQ